MAGTERERAPESPPATPTAPPVPQTGQPAGHQKGIWLLRRSQNTWELWMSPAAGALAQGAPSGQLGEVGAGKGEAAAPQGTQ